MEEYLKSKKYLIIATLICSLFAIMVSKAFDYMPKPIKDSSVNSSYSDKKTASKQINTLNDSDESGIEDDDYDSDEEDNTDEDSGDDDDNSQSENENQYQTEYKSTPSYSDNLMEIPAPKGTDEEEVIAID